MSTQLAEHSIVPSEDGKEQSKENSEENEVILMNMYLSSWHQTACTIVSRFVRENYATTSSKKYIPNDVIRVIVAFRFGRSHNSPSVRDRSFGDFVLAFRVVKYLVWQKRQPQLLLQELKKNSDQSQPKKKRKKSNSKFTVTKKELWNMIDNLHSAKIAMPKEIIEDFSIAIWFIDKRTLQVIPHLCHPPESANRNLKVHDNRPVADGNVLLAMSEDAAKWDTIVSRQHFYFANNYYSIITPSKDVLFGSWQDKVIIIYQLNYMFVVVSDVTKPSDDPGFRWSKRRLVSETERIINDLKNGGL